MNTDDQQQPVALDVDLDLPATASAEQAGLAEDADDDPLSRLKLLIGSDAVERLAGMRIVVAGLGAVGSFAVEALARSGVGCLRIIDFDSVTPSNINRQLFALHSTIGQSKVAVAQQRIAEIAPQCRVEPIIARVGKDNIFSLLQPRPDVVIDAIDSVCDKVSLIWACLSHQVPVVSSMGAARRFDPTCVRVGSLSEIQGCPLAKKVKKELKTVGYAENSAFSDFRCIYSIEPPAELRREGAGGCTSARAMGSSVCVTGVFGLVAAREAIRIILQA